MLRGRTAKPWNRFAKVCGGTAAIGKDVAASLKLRHDHGSNYMSNDFQTKIAFLGIEASPSFVHEPEGMASPSASSGR